MCIPCNHVKREALLVDGQENPSAQPCEKCNEWVWVSDKKRAIKAKKKRKAKILCGICAKNYCKERDPKEVELVHCNIGN